MLLDTRSLLIFLGGLGIAVCATSLLSYISQNNSTPKADVSISISTSTPVAVPSNISSTPISASSSPLESTSTSRISKVEKTTEEAVRIEDLYPFPPASVEVLSSATRSALVNILCIRKDGFSEAISGSGVIIDPRGVILTNAHIAQHILLTSTARSNFSCVIRSGSPATPYWNAEILYISQVWVQSHAREINTERPRGTGEHDYAILRITGSIDSTPIPVFPYLPIDTREAVAFYGDDVLVASYPAEFIGDTSVQSNLHPSSSITTIGQLLTFTSKAVDLISLGGIAPAQSGSSGGAVVNMWGRLVGLVSTVSDGETTAMRDLRALTLSYIDRDLIAQTQKSLADILAGDVVAQSMDFNTRIAPQLTALYQ